MSVNLTEEQFQTLLARLSPQKHGTFATCTAEFDGSKNSQMVEAFLAAATVFKQIENIPDAEALTGVPLLLKKEAAIWWQGVKEQVTSWKDFQDRLRYAFAPRKPAYVLYQEIVGEKQDCHTSTESFIAHKRMLFAQLPKPKQPECHQLDMIYGQLNSRIRDRVPRKSITTFDQLLEAARGIEQMWLDQSQSLIPPEREKNVKPVAPKKKKCGYCHFNGHTAEECRKLKRKQEEFGIQERASPTRPKAEVTTAVQVPCPSAPKLHCYGCGAPGVDRSSCPTCAAKRRSTPVSDISFCALNTEQDEAYSMLKRKLSTAPVLRQADDTKPFILITDASNYAFGAVLVQGEKDDEDPVEYASRLLTSAERNYFTTRDKKRTWTSKEAILPVPLAESSSGTEGEIVTHLIKTSSI